MRYLESLKLVEDGSGELRGGSSTANVLGSNGGISKDIVSGLGDSVGMLIETKVTQKHRGRKNHGGGVGLVAALNVKTNVSATGLKDSVLTANVDTGNETGATNKGSTNVTQNGTVKVGGDENVKLLWPRDSLHRSVVDNHVGVFNLGVFLTNLLDGGTEKTISQLHDVGLVDGGDLLTVVLQGKVVGETGDTLRLVLGDNLKRLNNTRNRLVLQTRVLTLGVLTDKSHVNTVNAGLDTGDVLDKNQGGVDVELTTKSDVERSMARLLNGGVKDTLQTNLVALERVDGLGDALAAVTNTGNLDLLPVNGNVLSLEDGLDRVSDFSTNTVTYQKRKHERLVKDK